jgi:uncharacterized protein YjgD (DUF1641 family)
MPEKSIQEQIDELNRKMDMILECTEEQKRSREAMNDLVTDLNVVAKDAFRHTVIMLDKAQVNLDQSDIPALLVRLLQNIDTFGEMIGLMESARDFMKDISPILHQTGLDAIVKMHELEQKGYFDIVRNLASPGVLDTLGRLSNALAVVKMDEKLDNRSLFGLMKQLNSPEVRRSLSFMLRVLQAMGSDAYVGEKG